MVLAVSIPRLAGSLNGHPPDAEDVGPSFPEAVPLLDAQSSPPALLCGAFAHENINLLVADGGVGKTTTLLHIIGALAAGAAPFDSLPAPDRPQRVLIVSGEDGIGHLQNRLEAFIAGHGWDRELVRRNVLALALEPDAMLDTDEGQRLLAFNIELGTVDVVCFDPLADLMQGNDADNADAKAVNRFLHAQVREGRTVFLAHHVTKPSEGKGKVHRVRGATSWYNAARAVWWLEGADGGLRMECLKLSAARRLEVLELSLQVEGEAGTWSRATLTAPGQGWGVVDRLELTPSAQKALHTLSLCPDEPLSFSAWKARAGISDTSLTDARRQLLDAGYVQPIETGRKHAGRPVHSYEATPQGLAALASQRRNAEATPDQRRPMLAKLNAATPTPPIGGRQADGSVLE